MKWKSSQATRTIKYLPTKKDALLKGASFLLLHAHARGHPEGGCDGGQYGDYDVQDFTPEVFFHKLWIMSYELWVLF